MVDPVSIAIGAGATLVSMLAGLGVFLSGYRAARRPESIVDMDEVQNYVMFKRTVGTASDDATEYREQSE